MVKRSTNRGKKRSGLLRPAPLVRMAHIGLANPLDENVRAALLSPVNRRPLGRQNGAGPLRSWLAHCVIAFAGATLDENPLIRQWNLHGSKVDRLDLINAR